MDLTAVVGDEDSYGYNKDTKMFGDKITTADAVLFVKVGKDFYAYNLRSLGNIAEQTGTRVLNSDDKVVAAYMEMASKPSGATTDTVYGIVTGGGNTVKVNDEYKKAYTVANDQETYTVYVGSNSSVISKGDIVSFEKASDDVYADDDITVYTSADKAYIKEMDGEDVLSYYAAVKQDNGIYVGDGALKTYALDDDCQIIYVDQDNDAAGSNIGVNEIQAIIIESSGKCNIL